MVTDAEKQEQVAKERQASRKEHFSPERLAELEALKKAVSRRGRAQELVGGRQFDVDEQLEIEDALDKDWYLSDFDTRSGKFGAWAVILLIDPETGKRVSTATGGEVVVKKLNALREGNHLPVLAAFKKVEAGEYGRYYDLV